MGGLVSSEKARWRPLEGKKTNVYKWILAGRFSKIGAQKKMFLIATLMMKKL